MNSEKLLQTNIAWLRDQISGMHYGEAGIRVIIHGGEVRRVERTITEKIQSGDNGDE